MCVFRAEHMILDDNYCVFPWGDYFSHSKHFLVPCSSSCRVEASCSSLIYFDTSLSVVIVQFMFRQLVILYRCNF